MPQTLTAVGAALTHIDPVLDVDHATLIGLNISFMLNFADEQGNAVPSTNVPITFNAWASLSPDQQANMQDIRNTIIASIIATYLA